MEIRVRKAEISDHEDIYENNLAMARETEGMDLEKVTVRKGTGAILDDAGKGFYLVAEAHGDITGQLMVTYEWSDWRNADLWWIQSVYVKPEYRRKGVYKMLYRHLLSMAGKDPGVCGVRLYVEKANRAAQEAYLALGMTRSEYLMYEAKP